MVGRMPLLAAAAPAHCLCGGPAPCVCLAAERALRWFADGLSPLPMTRAQREECMREIAAAEGAERYIRDAYVRASDSELANAVLRAWSEFCRAQGFT